MKRLDEEFSLELNVAEPVLLVQDERSVADVPESVLLFGELKVEFDRRLDEYHEGPKAGSPWEVVRARIRNRT